VTTGGGGWGDPLAREPELVRDDVIEDRVSLQAARDDYGVILIKPADADDYAVDEQATAERRAELSARRKGPLSMIDRGDGYEKMVRGECAPRMR
jgi:N-methylhydantoinase B